MSNRPDEHERVIVIADRRSEFPSLMVDSMTASDHRIVRSKIAKTIPRPKNKLLIAVNAGQSSHMLTSKLSAF